MTHVLRAPLRLLSSLSVSVVLVAALLLSGCGSSGPTALSQLTGEWENQSDGEPRARLAIFPDRTFHVDLLAVDGIEANGRIELNGNEITFMNEEGTDDTTADPRPGVYTYRVDGDQLRFEEVSDPLDRRVQNLTLPWVRVSATP